MDLDNLSVLVILGAKLDDFNRPKVALTFRLDKAIELYIPGRIQLLLSGKPKEVVGMKGYLIQQGVLEDDIILENQSQDTLSNLINSLAIIKTSRVGIITNAFHMPRVQSICKFLGYQNIEWISCDNPRKHYLRMYLREKMAYLKWEVRKRIGFKNTY